MHYLRLALTRFLQGLHIPPEKHTKNAKILRNSYKSFMVRIDEILKKKLM